MKKQINLEEILNNQFEPDYDFKLHYGNTTTINILEAMKEAVKQALELANTKIKTRTFRDGIVEYFIPNKTDILDTINQVI